MTYTPSDFDETVDAGLYTKGFATYPSISFAIFDVPEPKDINAKFVYNYFLNNERESEDTFGSDESFRANGLMNARQVDLSFTPLNDIIPESEVLSRINLSDTDKHLILSNNIDKIIKETDFGGNKNVSIKLQDATSAADLLANIEAFLQKKRIATAALSPMQTALLYSSQTTDNMDGQAMLDSVSVDDSHEYVQFDPATGDPYEVQKEGDIGKLTFNLIASKRFAADIATTAVRTPLSPTANIFSSAMSDLESIQYNARNQIRSEIIQTTDFVDSYPAISSFNAAPTDVFLGGNTVMGYHITRKNLSVEEESRHFFITESSLSNFSDTQVVYGTKYSYSISAVYLFRLLSVDNTGSVKFTDILVESRESPTMTVTCKEIVPPPAPDDLNFYVLQNGQLMIEWAFPITKQKDIKRFQVFKRQEAAQPFVLIGEIDFDDSTVQTDRSEYVYDNATNKVSSPITYLNDPLFNFDSKGIYAVCAIDAHDLSSPYSEQFMVSYDRNHAALVVELFSEKNAPKPYPNFFLRSQLVENVMTDSNHQSLSLYFDPEYFHVHNADGIELDFIQSSETNPSYKLQLIHLNFQQNAVADIKIK